MLISSPVVPAWSLSRPFVLMYFQGMEPEPHDHAAFAIGTVIGIVLGSLIIAAILYGIVRLIRGNGRGPEPTRFILISALVIAVLCTLGRLVGSGSTSPTSGTEANIPKLTEKAEPPPAPPVVQSVWPFEPLVDGPWDVQDMKSSRTLLNSLSESTPAKWLGSARAISAFRCTSLDFYPDALLCEGLVKEDPTRPSVFTFVYLKDGSSVTLDGTSPPIYQLNEKAPLNIATTGRAEHYLRFFDAAVFASNGNFLIADSPESMNWSHDATEADKQKVAKYVRPLAFALGENDRWKASGTVQYASDLFNAVFYIDKSADANGKVEMAEDFPLVQNLPLRRDAFDGPLRYEVALYK